MTNASASSNRRLTARRACRLTVRYKGSGDFRPATAMDLSLQGCRLRVGEDLRRESPITVEFEGLVGAGSGTSLEVAVQGTVMWCRREGLSYQAGIHFDEASQGLQDILNALA